jgi:trans-aconitate methyltransferase
MNLCAGGRRIELSNKFAPQFYDEGWEGGWDDMKVFGPTARHTRRLIFKLLDGISFDTVLDAGCGTGVLLQQISQEYPRVQLTGSEYSPHGIEFARKRLPDVEFHALDLSKASLQRKFDLITCIDVLEHIPDDRAALKNLLQMTGGHMILAVPLGPLFTAEVERMGHVHGYSRKELESKIREAGFEIVRVIQWGFPFYNIHRRVANRIPQNVTAGDYSATKKFFSSLIYGMFFLNLPFGGERYYVLCRPAGHGADPALESAS